MMDNKRIWAMAVAVLAALFLCIGATCSVGWFVSKGLTTPATHLAPSGVPSTAAQSAPSSPPSPAAAGQVPPSGPVALRVQMATDREPRAGEPFEVRIKVQSEGSTQARVYLVAFRGNLAVIVERALQPLPLSWDIEYPNGADRVVVAQYDGVPAPATFSFGAVSYLDTTWDGDVVICVTPEISPDTCAVLPLQITIQP